jgi:hypothetical protein
MLTREHKEKKSEDKLTKGKKSKSLHKKRAHKNHSKSQNKTAKKEVHFKKQHKAKLGDEVDEDKVLMKSLANVEKNLGNKKSTPKIVKEVKNVTAAA